LILSPTRELARQTHKVVLALGDYLNVTCHLSVGGTKSNEDRQALQRLPHVVVGTPGRIKDMLQRRCLEVGEMKILVVDEADEMLGQGFLNDIHDVFKFLPSSIQVVLFSATLPNEILEVTNRFMRDPVRIIVKAEELTLHGIAQFHINLEDPSWKLDTLCDLWEQIAIDQCVIFCNTRRSAERLAEDMNARDFAVSMVHGVMAEEDRRARFEDFKRGTTRVLIATDLYARGIDVQGVSTVVNFDIPTENLETYIHRIGRSGRFGRKGVAINLVSSQRDERAIRDIEQFYGTEIPEMPATFTGCL